MGGCGWGERITVIPSETESFPDTIIQGKHLKSFLLFFFTDQHLQYFVTLVTGCFAGSSFDPKRGHNINTDCDNQKIMEVEWCHYLHDSACFLSFHFLSLLSGLLCWSAFGLIDKILFPRIDLCQLNKIKQHSDGCFYRLSCDLLSLFSTQV